ncbi:MAG: DUF262 domain-containing protein [Thermotogota bacterium]|nr:DUF262 domain-containing protein [Thermotogota bacterium]
MNYVQNLINLEELMKDNLFKIPDYQRGYSWEEHQLEDFTKDIDHISGKDHLHYTGTIVITKSNRTPGRYEVVDGQQRITTLIILLKCMNDIGGNKYPIKDVYLKRGELGNETYVLETNNETQDFFRDCIINDNHNLVQDIKSKEKLLKAKTYFSKWISKNVARMDEICKIITTQLGFICYAPDNTKEIGIMFEVINNRGKELSELEKIKNYFIYYATIHDKHTLRKNINESWGQILRYLSIAGVATNEEENYFLRNCFIVFYSPGKNKSWYVYDEIKERYRPEDISDLDSKIEEIKKFVSFLIKCSQNHAYFYDCHLFNNEYQNSNYKEKISKRLKRLRCHPINASIFPLYLAGMTYLYSNPDFLSKFLELLEILNFRIYVLPNTKIARADSKQGDLFSWAHELYWDTDWHSDDDGDCYTYMDRKIEGGLFSYTIMNLEDFVKYFCPEEVFIQSLTVDEDEAIDYFHWPGLRFFLASYEEKLYSLSKESWDIEKILTTRDEAKERINDYLSREHIWAVKNRVNDFPESTKDKRRLGNFVLIGLSKNIQLQELDVEEKIAQLIENDTISLRQVNNLKKYVSHAKDFAGNRRTRKTKYYYEELAIKLIDQRENDLINFALERWKMQNEKFNKFIKIDSFAAWENGLNENYFFKKKAK